MWQFRSPEIVFGENALTHLAGLTGRRAFIVTDPVIVSLGHVDTVREQLQAAGMDCAVFTEVEPEPSLQTTRRGAEAIRAFQPDWIVGLGGGSVMDAALVMRILYERPDLPPEAINPFEPLGLTSKVRLICVPTTAGTGSEVTVGAVLTDVEAQRKLEVASFEAIADIAIVDPQLTAHMPRQLTADTGMDVLTHSVEGYSSTWANDFTDGLCLQATRMAFDYLPRAVEHGAADPEAREKMANAATIAGLGMGNSHIALAHAMGHGAGAIFHLPHGRITGLALPYTIEYAANGGAGRYLELTKFVGLPVEDETQAGTCLASAIRDLMRRIGQPLSLQAAGVSRENFEANLGATCDRAEMDASLITTRRIPERAELERLFRYAYEGKSIDF